MTLKHVNPAHRARIRAERQAIIDQQKLVMRCTDCRWYFRGKFGDARAAIKTHRELKHNERSSA